MNADRNDFLLYAVTDRSWLGSQTLCDQVEQALLGGATCVQLREKQLDETAFLEEARALRRLCRAYHVPLIINDSVDIALAVDADGVHVGQDDLEAGAARQKLGPHKILGVSAHSVEQARRAQAQGADYLGVGAVFPTATKADAGALPPGELGAICRAVPLPVVAIGGRHSGQCAIARRHRYRRGGGGQRPVRPGGYPPGRRPAAAAAGDRRLPPDPISSRGGLGAPPSVALQNGMLKGVSYGNSIDDRWERFQRRRRYPGRHQDHDRPRRIRHERHHGPDRAEHHRRHWHFGSSTRIFWRSSSTVVFTDIPPQAVKVGMVSSAPLIQVIARKLRQYTAPNVVVDPVMVATSGARLMEESAVDTLRRELLPLATVLTPNLPEAEMLSGQSISTPADMERCARLIGETYGCAVLCKGGHEVNSANDYLWQPGGGRWFYGRRIDNPNTHGTGCTLSSAIASNLARGRDLEEAVYEAKCYLSRRPGRHAGPGPWQRTDEPRFRHRRAIYTIYLTGQRRE